MKTIALFSLFCAVILGTFSLAQAQSFAGKRAATEFSRCGNGDYGHNGGGRYGGGHHGGHY